MDYYAISQCTPGISLVNTATFVGYITAGIPGVSGACIPLHRDHCDYF